MIYEMVKNQLISLSNQWLEVSNELKRLEASLPGSDSRRVLLNTWSDDCRDEYESIDSELSSPSFDPPPAAQQLFDNALQVVRNSYDDLRGTADESGIKDLFDFNFPESNTDLSAVISCRAMLVRLEDFITRGIQEFAEIMTIEGERFHIKGIRESVGDLTSFPILTSTPVAVPQIALVPNGTTSTGTLQQLVDGAWRDVLGRLPKPRDTRSFMTSLNQSFTLKQIEGHIEFNWTPRSFAGQTDLGGGVSGAQASLYKRGKVALENSLPLLDGLYPLLPDADHEEVEAARAIVRSQLNELVSEFSIEGGPRVQRVETIFGLLLNQDTTGIDGKLVPGGKLGYLESVFGLNGGQVNTPDEETNVTNFIVLRDYVRSLRTSWKEFRNTWLGRDLGTRLVLLSRALSVSAETVSEVYAAMDSVFVGAAERQVSSFQITINDTPSQMLVEELLSWVYVFTSEEAPHLIHEGGRRGIETIIPTVVQLQKLIGQLISALASDARLPDGLRHPRVRHPLQELRSYLQKVQQLAEDVRKPISEPNKVTSATHTCCVCS